MSYLISISIGPVQDFIASARRSRDLWFGSWLLSELSKTVAKKIGKENLIFPAISNDEHLEEYSKFNVVNKILAVVSDIDADFDESLRRAINQRLEGIYKDIFDKIESDLPKSEKIFYRAEAEAQIKDLTELYWAAIPFDESKDDYKICRERVEILLNARKSTRNFSKATWSKSVPKSSLDGQRESVIDEKAFDNLTTKQLREIFGIREKERLCGVGILKRLGNARDRKGNKIDSFFSTSHIAAQPFLQRLKEDENTNKEKVKEFVKVVREQLNLSEKDLGIVPHQEPYKTHSVFSRQIDGKLKGYDGHLLFENRLKDFVDERKNKQEAKVNLLEAKTAVAGFVKNILKGAVLNPYYALLLADGDNMGKAIDNTDDNIDNKDRHKELSMELSAFAGEVEKIVIEKYNGSLIYAGGDDVLAFLPLHTVLDCGKKLAEIFKSKLERFAFTENGKTKKPTLSVGVAIYHHTEPLQDALATVRRAEKEAKNFDPKNKNALAIILSKRSGADRTIKGGWENDRDTGKSFDERLKWFIQLHLDDALPDGAAYEIRDLWLRLKELIDQKPMRKEAVRILRRKRSNQGLSKVSKEILDEIEPLILSQEFSLKDLTNEIIVARDFARAYRQANIERII